MDTGAWTGFFEWKAAEVDGIVYGDPGPTNNSLNRFQLTAGSVTEIPIDGYFNLLSLRMRSVSTQPQIDTWWGLDAFGENTMMLYQIASSRREMA